MARKLLDTNSLIEVFSAIKRAIASIASASSQKQDKVVVEDETLII